MAGHTGHHLPGALVDHLVADGMAELALGQMATGTDLVAIIPQHGQPVRAMYLMAFAAGVDPRVPMPALRIAGIGVHMTGLAYLVAGILQHFFIIRGMGTVTLDTAIFRSGDHMIMRRHHAGLHPRMTPQTGLVPGILLLPMTGIAFVLGVGLVKMLPDKPLAGAAMGIVTGKTAAELAGKATMPGTVLRLLMTGETQSSGFHLEELAVFGLMGLVTDRTLALGKGFMGYSLRRCQFLVTDKTGFRQAFSKQTIMGCGVRSMAGQAFSIPNRHMHHPFDKLGFRPPMARVTERGAFPLQQPWIFGDMGVMAISTLALGHRAMGKLAAEILPGMARVANLFGHCDRTGEPDEQAEYSQSNKQAPHQLFLPGWHALQLPCLKGACCTGYKSPFAGAPWGSWQERHDFPEGFIPECTLLNRAPSP
jgi:hypothetical protein